MFNDYKTRVLMGKKYKGIFDGKNGVYYVRVGRGGKHTTYKTLREAKDAYNKGALAKWGSFARLNK